MDCSCAFTDYLANCQNEILVHFYSLNPGETYKVVITDKFGKQYSHNYLSDGDGMITLNVADFPDGMFNVPGEFKLEVFSFVGLYGDYQCEKLPLALAKYYDHILFEVRTGTNTKTNLGCGI
jgi:hypothetical protein